MWNPNGFGNSTANLAIPRVPNVASCLIQRLRVRLRVQRLRVADHACSAKRRFAASAFWAGTFQSKPQKPKNYGQSQAAENVCNVHLCRLSRYLQMWIRTWWPPGAKATKVLACIEDWTDYDRLWQAAKVFLRHFKRFQAHGCPMDANDWDVQSHMDQNGGQLPSCGNISKPGYLRNLWELTSCHVVSRRVTSCLSS